jgi:ABC-2 type transport system ATP-binding protein
VTDDGNAAIRCAGVVKRFGEFTALDGLELTVGRGRIVGYLGPNGAGKSTTIRILVDLARADAGEVRVLGADPRRSGPELRRRIGYLPGELRLDDRLTVAETLRSWAVLRGGVDDAYTTQLCEQLALDTQRGVRGLSTGNRRKVGLVGAFMARPELLILDEPTAALDPMVQTEVHRLVEDARGEGRTVFLSSHILSEVQRMADEAILIRQGRIVASGDVDTLRRGARQEFTVWFGGPPPADELRRAAGVRSVVVRGREVSGLVEGTPNELLAVLARHPVEHLLLPEADLEQAFLHFYEAEPTA